MGINLETTNWRMCTESDTSKQSVSNGNLSSTTIPVNTKLYEIYMSWQRENQFSLKDSHITEYINHNSKQAPCPELVSQQTNTDTPLMAF